MLSKKHPVARKPAQGMKTLRQLKSLQPDDVRKLENILTSEMSPVVQCHNHAVDLENEREVDRLYRHHLLTMRKLARGQNSEYRNLMRVKVGIRC